MAAEKYGPLKGHILRRAPMRLALHGPLRDRLVEMVVEEWPTGCEPGRLEEVLRARVSVRLRQKYGSVMAIILLSALANLVIRLIVEWWFSADVHRVMIADWAAHARRVA